MGAKAEAVATQAAATNARCIDIHLHVLRLSFIQEMPSIINVSYKGRVTKTWK